jgi:hypothetical protein
MEQIKELNYLYSMKELIKLKLMECKFKIFTTSICLKNKIKTIIWGKILRGIEECNYFHLFKKFKENETN